MSADLHVMQIIVHRLTELMSDAWDYTVIQRKQSEIKHKSSTEFSIHEQAWLGKKRGHYFLLLLYTTLRYDDFKI